MRPGRADQPPDASVRRTAGDAVIPCEQVPEDGSRYVPKNDNLGRVRGVDEAGRDRLGDPADLGCPDEDEDAGHDEGRKRSEDSSYDDGGDDISRVVESIRIVENQAQNYDGDDFHV